MGPHRHPRVSEGARASPSAPLLFSPDAWLPLRGLGPGEEPVYLPECMFFSPFGVLFSSGRISVFFGTVLEMIAFSR